MGENEAGDELFCGPCEEGADENIDAEVEVEAEEQQVATDPGQPTKAEKEAHEVTHFPFRPWCRACVLGRAKDAPSRKVKGLFAETVLPRVRMDYAFLTEDVKKTEGEEGEGETQKSGESVTIAVMQESLCKSIWAYAVTSKGASEQWMVEQVLEDLETIGLKNERIVLKSDQEPSIVEVLREVQKGRESEYGSAMDNSRVGDSDSNGTIENSIGAVEGMVRTLRVALEEKLGQKIQLSDPVMPWLVRHAGHLITRCWIRPSGRPHTRSSRAGDPTSSS